MFQLAMVLLWSFFNNYNKSYAMLYIQDDKFLAVAAIIQNVMNGSCRLFFGFLFDRLGFKVFSQHFEWSTMSFSVVSNDIFRIHTSFKVLLVPVSPSFLWTSYSLMGMMLEQRHSSFLCHLPCMLLYQVKCKANGKYFSECKILHLSRFCIAVPTSNYASLWTPAHSHHKWSNEVNSCKSTLYAL